MDCESWYHNSHLMHPPLHPDIFWWPCRWPSYKKPWSLCRLLCSAPTVWMEQTLTSQTSQTLWWSARTRMCRQKQPEDPPPQRSLPTGDVSLTPCHHTRVRRKTHTTCRSAIPLLHNSLIKNIINIFSPCFHYSCSQLLISMFLFCNYAK